MNNPIQIVANLVQDIIANTETSNIGKAQKSIKILFPILKEFPTLIWDDSILYNTSLALMMAYHTDTFEEEDDNLLLTHLAFAYLTRAQELAIENSPENQNQLFNILRTKVILLKTCEDSFIDTISKLYLIRQEANYKNKHTCLQLANTIIPLVQYHVLLEIDDTFNGFNNDDALEEICNEIELSRESISDKLMKEASNINNLLFIYIKNKLSTKDYNF